MASQSERWTTDGLDWWFWNDFPPLSLQFSLIVRLAIRVLSLSIKIIDFYIQFVTISKKDIPLANLYTFSIFPYKLLDIAHVYRRDEHPWLQSSSYDYQRPLIYKKLKEIREKLLTNQDFIFPSNILVILSKECKFIKDKESENYLRKKQKKYGYENLFNTEISELSERDILVKEGVVLIERYFNEVFSVLKQDKPRSKNDPKTSFLLAKFWSGWINLLIVFLEEGSDWTIIKDELYKIKNNIIRLREIDNYEAPLFKPDDENIPDSSHSPTKVCKFLNQNRKEPTSIQDIKKW